MIAKYIRKLIEEEGKEEVIIPSFGTFIAGYRESQIQGDTLQPPGKKVTFYPKLKTDHSDFFKQTVVVEEGVTPEQFDELLDDFITRANDELDENGRFEVEGVGTLSVNPEGGLLFEQDDSSSFGGDAFGLPVVERKPVSHTQVVEDSNDKETEEEPKEEEETENVAVVGVAQETDSDDDKKQDAESDESEEDTTENNNEPHYDYSDMTGEDDEERKKRRSALIAWLIIIPLLFGLAFIAFWFTQQDKLDNLSDGENISMTEENVSDENSGAEVSPDEAGVATEEVTGEEEGGVTEENTTESTEETAPDPKPTPDAGTLSGKTGRFYIVRASYKEQANAQAMRQELLAKGYESKMIPYDPEEFHRVTLGDYSSLRDAYNARNKLTGEYPDSWVVQY